ncbi:MAG TPA: hypothetical protein VEX35_08750 [Allosphingosinicella sp.]|nr:hypothetical protein [Allosphingosinicella sp.]
MIFTGTTNSTVRPSQGIATVPLPSAAPPESFKPTPEPKQHWILAGIALPGWSIDESEAIFKPVGRALSELGPEAKAAVKAFALWQSSTALAAAFLDADAAWPTKLGKAIDAAGGLAALVTACAPPIAATGAFRFIDHTLTLGKAVADVLEDVTEKPRPPMGVRNAPRKPA